MAPSGSDMLHSLVETIRGDPEYSEHMKIAGAILIGIQIQETDPPLAKELLNAGIERDAESEAYMLSAKAFLDQVLAAIREKREASDD